MVKCWSMAIHRVWRVAGVCDGGQKLGDGDSSGGAGSRKLGGIEGGGGEGRGEKGQNKTRPRKTRLKKLHATSRRHVPICQFPAERSASPVISLSRLPS